MADDECIHGMLLGTCSICKHGPTRAEPITVESPPFRAKYPGRCAGRCDSDIHEDQMIVRLSNERYAHVGCAGE